MTVNKLHDQLQSVYGAFFSSEIALVKVRNDIRVMIDDKKDIIV